MLIILQENMQLNNLRKKSILLVFDSNSVLEKLKLSPPELPGS